MPETISRNDLAAADVLLYRGEGWLSRAIQFFDGTEMSHAGLFLGDGSVGEAIGQGLVRRTLAASIGTGHPRVVARRLKQTPSTYSPVLDQAEGFLAEGQRYGYEQLLLLAFLALTRKLKVTPVLRALLRSVLDSAAAVVTRLTAAGREPMICSEFVFRCYDGALPAADDEYSIEVNPYPSAALVTTRVSASPGRIRGKGVHPDSLLVLTAASTTRAWRGRAPRVPAILPAHEAIDEAGLNALIARYLDEATATGSPRGRSAGRVSSVATRTSDDDMRAAVLRFAAAWMAVPRPGGFPAGAGVTPATRAVRPLDHLLRTAADFVTPGDLLQSESLLTVGDVPISSGSGPSRGRIKSAAAAAPRGGARARTRRGRR